MLFEQLDELKILKFYLMLTRVLHKLQCVMEFEKNYLKYFYHHRLDENETNFYNYDDVLFDIKINNFFLKNTSTFQ